MPLILSLSFLVMTLLNYNVSYSEIFPYLVTRGGISEYEGMDTSEAAAGEGPQRNDPNAPQRCIYFFSSYF